MGRALATASLPSRPVTLLAVGKAAAPMARTFVERAPSGVRAGLVIATHGREIVPPGLVFLEGSHPLPDSRSERAGREALRLAGAMPRDECLVVLISGGASALMACPASGITLAHKQAVTGALLAAGADIASLNAVRKHLSAIKGGRLAAACPGMVVAWLLSDVVGDDPAVIGSGPTVGDPSTFQDALHVLDAHGGRAVFPPDVVDTLERGARGETPETPKPGDPALSRTTSTVVGSAAVSVIGAAEAARARGYAVVVRPAPVVGEAREAASGLLEWAGAVLETHRGRTCLLSSGETTVTVRGRGRGGRNQELVLAIAPGLAALGRPVLVSSIGTDGVDGPTDAAGAVADETTMRRAAARGLDAAGSLARNDSWSFFDALGDLVRTGLTDTNVGDVQVVLAGPRPAGVTGRPPDAGI